MIYVPIDRNRNNWLVPSKSDENREATITECHETDRNRYRRIPRKTSNATVRQLSRALHCAVKMLFPGSVQLWKSVNCAFCREHRRVCRSGLSMAIQVGSGRADQTYRPQFCGFHMIRVSARPTPGTDSYAHRESNCRICADPRKPFGRMVSNYFAVNFIRLCPRTDEREQRYVFR